jgi:superoxide dismutase, Fe-Mn family
MKNLLILLTCSLILFTACKKEKELIEVGIPEPEKTNEKGEVTKPEDVKAEDEEGAFQMKGLPYAYNALEPFVDATTMETHYSKHHVTYCNKLNAAIKGTDLETKTIEEILTKLDLNKADVRNNAGGYYNHNFFFEIMAPNAGGEPTETALIEAINDDFGSFEDFKNLFSEKATKLFGSGWAWLVMDKTGKLVICTTPNQDNPLMPKMEQKGHPILALDVWEHAYYLKYKNKRKDYIENFFNVINWKKVAEKFANGPKRKEKTATPETTSVSSEKITTTNTEEVK